MNDRIDSFSGDSRCEVSGHIGEVGGACGHCGTGLDGVEHVIELGPRSTPRIAATPCPGCGEQGGLRVMARRRMIDTGGVLSGSTPKLSVRLQMVPVLECSSCGYARAGSFSTGGVTFD